MTELEAGIVTDDLEVSTAFYVDGLGFELVQTLVFPQGEVRKLRRGGARLKLYRPVTTPAAPAPAEPWFRDRGFAYAALVVDDAAAVVAGAAAHGAGVLTPVTEHRPGARFALVRDPHGNVWEILEEPEPPS